MLNGSPFATVYCLVGETGRLNEVVSTRQAKKASGRVSPYRGLARQRAISVLSSPDWFMTARALVLADSFEVFIAS